MSIRKRNEFLDDGESEEELGNDYDSEPVEESRGDTIRHAMKRRKVDEEVLFDDDDDEGPSPSDDESIAIQEVSAAELDLSTAKSILRSTNKKAMTPKEEGDVAERMFSSPSTEDSKPSAFKQAEKARKAVRKSGVIYLSRVPPFMKPHTLRHFLEPHAPKGLGRIFLTPEDHAHYQKRVKNGGNKKKSFTDGWVEFVSKTEAKAAAEILNGNIIGGKKGNFYHDDIWTIKYLKSFKWNHLTEQITNENAERASRLREEIRKTREENKAFVMNIEKSKMLDGMESKRKVKQQRSEDAGSSSLVVEPVTRLKSEFKQRKTQSKDAKAGGVEPGKDTTGILKKIF